MNKGKQEVDKLIEAKYKISRTRNLGNFESITVESEMSISTSSDTYQVDMYEVRQKVHNIVAEDLMNFGNIKLSSSIEEKAKRLVSRNKSTLPIIISILKKYGFNTLKDIKENVITEIHEQINKLLKVYDKK